MDKPNIITKKTDQKDPPNWVRLKPENFCEKFMVVAGISGRGTLPIIKVDPKVKINSEFYINSVLKPYCEKYLPILYPDDLHKVFIHHDAATSHTSLKTMQYATDIFDKCGIRIISKNMIPVKSPDGSPMDFFAFGFLKNSLSKRRATTISGLWKLVNEVWSTIDHDMIIRVFKSWKRRLRLINKMDGEHIENFKGIHNRKLKEL